MQMKRPYDAGQKHHHAGPKDHTVSPCPLVPPGPLTLPSCQPRSRLSTMDTWSGPGVLDKIPRLAPKAATINRAAQGP